MDTEILKGYILQFAASCTLADHIGDVAGDLDKLLKLIGFDQEWSDFEELHDILADMQITTLYGTQLNANPEEDEDEES